MDFLDVIRSRRSIRFFKELEVEEEKIKKIIDVATEAPSACNRQDWRFIVVTDQSLKNLIVDAGGAVIIKTAPAVIFALYPNITSNTEYQDHLQSAAAAIQNSLLAINYYGLGGCWICHLPSKKMLRKILNIPGNFDPVAAILVGYPAKEPSKINKKNCAEQIISYNKFYFPQAVGISKENFIIIKKILIFIYKRTPLFIKKIILNKFVDKKFVKKFDN